MKKATAFTFFLFGFSLALLQAQPTDVQKDTTKKNIEIITLKAQISKSNSTQKFEIYKKLSSIYAEENDSLAAFYADEMLKIARNKQNNTQIGQALFFLGKSYTESSKVKALEYYNEAEPLLVSANDDLLKDLYYSKSSIYTIFSEFPEALNYGLKSLAYNQTHNHQTKILRDMSFIGYIYDRMYEFNESIKWNRQALKLAIKLKNVQGEALCYGRIGIAYDELAERDNFNEKLFDSALYYNLKAAKISEQNNMLGFSRTTYSNIGNTYSKLKNYKKAEEYTLKSLAVPGFESYKGVTLVNLGKIYLETNRFVQAKKILDSAMQNTLKYGTRKYQLEAYYRLHELDVKKEDYQSALKNYIAYKEIEDALLNETKTKQIAEMSERYKSAEKEQQILRQRADLAEKNLIIQKKNVQMYGLIALTLLLIVLGYLFYKQQKLKNRQLQNENELKEAILKIESQNKLQEQRLQISRDLHDNIGAQLTFIISSLDNLKYGFKLPEKLNYRLETLSEFTTETITDLRDTIWAMNKNNISFDDLQSRVSNFIEKANLAAHEIEFNFTSDESLKNTTFSSVTGMNIYRIIQEAINNAIKYAHASQIAVSFTETEKTINITIRDNGKGFSLDEVQTGNGINNMKKRAQDIKAILQIKSEEDKGTRITVTLNK
ncbi:MAG TPA: sensor histidine kinase [Flavobacteriaceae bacterium]|nr:sensor histidine kinase [Flavobacteriaceae bacterium]